MNKFSDAYSAAKSALDSGALSGDFKNLQAALKSLLASSDGPDASQKAQMEKLRECINKGAKPLTVKGTSAARAEAKTIITGAGDGVKLTERASALKMLRHFYHEKEVGGQTIWVYSPPAVYTKWLFDEVAGATATVLEDTLAKDGTEVYTAAERGTMATALQMARTVALDAAVKADGASTESKAVVRRYFGNAASKDEDITTILTTLAAGYKKIANAANTGNVVISDEPGDRTGGGWKDWAFIYQTEAMSVIYLQGAWLKKAKEATPSNQSPLYRCARTIIHELSHKQLSTEDIVYGPKGLMVEGSSALTPEYALHNADSWAYCAMDLVGKLTGPDKTNGETACSAILKTPARTLTTT